MKALARWTCGLVTQPGLEILVASLRRFRVIYPEFDSIICCNNLKEQQLDFIQKNLHADLYFQDPTELGYPLTPVTAPLGWKSAFPHWGIKLCPPRLRIESHELWLDNDIMVRARVPSIDRWLQSDKCIIATGHGKQYEEFDSLIPPDKICSAGFFGLPPGYDFGKELVETCNRMLKGLPLGYYNEQGLVVYTVTNKPHIMAPMEDVFIVKHMPDKPLPPAMHFIGSNRQDRHEHWSQYRLYSSHL